MKWKFWHKENQLTTLDPHLAAFVILDRMSKHQSPFNEWRPKGVDIPEAAEAFIEVGVWAYQLTIFVDRIEHKFGSDTAKIVESHILTLADRVDKRQVIKKYLGAVLLGRASTEREPFFADQPDIQIDCNVAKALLDTSAESEETKKAVYPILGNALTLGRLSALLRFSPLVEKMKFRPESVIGLRAPQETPIEWSRSPGCFERHLERRFQNPLFPLDRRKVTTAELITARSRDAADLSGLRLQFRTAVEEMSALGDRAPFSQLLKLRKQLEELVLRCAQIGAPAAKEKAAVQELHDSVVECMRQACPAEERQRLTDALSKSANMQKMYANEFFAQLTRSDTPVLAEDVIPALMSESIEIVRLYITFLSEAGQTIDKEALRHAAMLVKKITAEGSVVPEIEEKLKLLSGSAAVGQS